MAVGGKGGTRIITCVAQTILNYFEYGMPLLDSVAKPRFHHQWIPDELQFDAPGPSADVQASLTKMGYKLNVSPGKVFCHVVAVAREKNLLHGASDPREVGLAGGY